MIAYVKGEITQLEPSFAIVECQGIGYWLKISLYTYNQIRDKKQVILHTYLQIREDAHVLYGFAETEERKVFEQLISISGVGGNTALMILSSLTLGELQTAIQTENATVLKRVKGIGAKTAGRIILELKDKLNDQLPGAGQKQSTGELHTKKQEALTALTNLGLPGKSMEKRLDSIIKEHGRDISVEQLIKLALRNPS